MKVVTDAWDVKIERADFLASRHKATQEILHFYSKILHFQQYVQANLDPTAGDIADLLPFVPELRDLLMHAGTKELKELAGDSLARDWRTEFETFWNERSAREYTPKSFIAFTLVQPFARGLALQSGAKGPQLEPKCPFCLSAPQLGVLRPEGDGGKRYLLCSLCGTEWEYRRVICPACGESDKEKLPVFKSDGAPHIKLAACDTCAAYLKCIDLCVDGHAVPEIEDVATLPMSLWMAQNGYSPIRPNLFGF